MNHKSNTYLPCTEGLLHNSLHVSFWCLVGTSHRHTGVGTMEESEETWLPHEQDEVMDEAEWRSESATMKLFRRPLAALPFRGEVVPSSSIRSAAIKCPEKKQCEGRAHSLKVQSTVKESHGSRHLKIQLLATHPQTRKQGEMNGCCLAHFLFHLGPSNQTTNQSI